MTVPPDAPPASRPEPSSESAIGRARGLDPIDAPSARPSIDEICPYLLALDGWRSAGVHRDHRCTAVDPPASLASEKQRRLCLTSEHGGCPTYRAARAARAATLAPGTDPAIVAAADANRRPLARSTPVVLEHARLTASRARWPASRGVSQAALVALMVGAFVLLGIARLPSSGSAVVTPHPSSSPSSSPSPTPSPSPSLSQTTSPSADPSTSPSPSASTAPSAQTGYRSTYKVKKGDTLLGIATQYGTTPAAIRSLNALSGSSLKIGQVLKIP